MSTSLTAEELIDELAAIELERQEKAREAGNAVACSAALRSLEKLQTTEKEALRTQGPSDVHSANLARLTTEIARVQKLGGTTNRSPNRPNRAQQPQQGRRPGKDANRESGRRR